MFGEGHHDSIIQRGIDETLACQDMLGRAPQQPSLPQRAIAVLRAVLRAAVHRTAAGRRRTHSASALTR